MPIYEFTCKKCGKEFSYTYYRSDDIAECPHCGEVHGKEDRHEMSVSNFKLNFRNIPV